MSENIFFLLDDDDLNRSKDVDLSSIYRHLENTTFENDLQKEEESDNIIYSKFLNYQLNFNIKQLMLICEYYGVAKDIKVNKCKKEEIISTIIYYENNPKNNDTVEKRKKLWFYMSELKNDKMMKKYILWN